MSDVLLIVLGAVLASMSGLLLAWWRACVDSRNALDSARRRWSDELEDVATHLDIFIKKLPARIPLTGPSLTRNETRIDVLLRRFENNRDTILAFQDERTRKALYLIYGTLHGLGERVLAAPCFADEKKRDAELKLIREIATGLLKSIEDVQRNL